MSLSGAQNMFMPVNINSIVLFECLFIENDGLEKIHRDSFSAEIRNGALMNY